MEPPPLKDVPTYHTGKAKRKIVIIFQKISSLVRGEK
jgi:hypothetical protein